MSNNESTDSTDTQTLPRPAALWSWASDRVASAQGVSKPTWYVFALALVLFVGFSSYTILLYRGYWQGGTDFGTYVHMLATTLDGEGWLLQGKYRANHPGGSYWGAHFSLTVLLYLVPYAVVQSPVTLLVTKSAVVAGSIVAFWGVVRSHLPHESQDRLALVATVAYALCPFLWSAWVFDVQEQAFIPLFAFLAYLCYRHSRYVLAVVGFGLVAATNEFEVYIVAGFLVGLLVEELDLNPDLGRDRDRDGDRGFGLALNRDMWSRVRSGDLPTRKEIFRHPRPAVGCLCAALAVVAIVKVVSGVAIAAFSVSGGIPLTNVADPLKPYVSSAGAAETRATVGGLVRAGMIHPDALVESLLQDLQTKVSFLILLTASTLFLVFYSPAALMALVPFFGVAWILTGIGAYPRYVAHYPFYLLPFVFIGFVRVLAARRDLSTTGVGTTGFEFGMQGGRGGRGAGSDGSKRQPRPSARKGVQGAHSGTDHSLPSSDLVIRALLAIALIGAASAAGGSFGYRYQTSPDGGLGAGDGGHAAVLGGAIEVIPANASVLTQNAIYPHIATRPNATFVGNANFQDYTAKYGLPSPEYILLDYNISDHYDTRSNVAGRVLSNYEDRIGPDGEYRVWKYQDGVVVYKRGYEGLPRGITRPYTVDSQWVNASELSVGEGHYTAGNRSIVAQFRDGGGAEDEALWYGPYTTLPPGEYEAVYRVRVRSGGSGSGGSRLGSGSSGSRSSENDATTVLNVAASENHTVVGEKRVSETDGWQNVSVPFTLRSRTDRVEFRGFAAGSSSGAVRVRGVRVNSTVG